MQKAQKMSNVSNDRTASPRAAQLVQELGLAPHPEGGWYREVFRSSQTVQSSGAGSSGRPARSALTTIDFLLTQGQFSAWHRVLSDEVWHLLEGQALKLWLLPAELGTASASALQMAVLSPSTRMRHVVPAGWWQAAEPVGELAYVGATVAPGFEFADFSFGRDDPALCQALAQHWPAAQRLL
jgi:uncharacterized protein